MKNPVKRVHPAASRLSKPKARPYRRIVIYRHKRTGRQVPRSWALSHKRSVRGVHGYISEVTGKRISKDLINTDWRVQAMRELAREQMVTVTTRKGKVIKRYRHQVSEKGARAQLRGIVDVLKADKDEIRAIEPTYRRWIKWLAKHTPEILPPALRTQIEGKMMIGGREVEVPLLRGREDVARFLKIAKTQYPDIEEEAEASEGEGWDILTDDELEDADEEAGAPFLRSEEEALEHLRLIMKHFPKLKSKAKKKKKKSRRR